MSTIIACQKLRPCELSEVNGAKDLEVSCEEPKIEGELCLGLNGEIEEDSDQSSYHTDGDDNSSCHIALRCALRGWTTLASIGLTIEKPRGAFSASNT